MKTIAFLSDILGHPDEDAPRLIYADWLEEHGDECGRAKAEFIRLQYELHRLTADGLQRGDLELHSGGVYFRHQDDDAERVSSMQRRQEELLRRHAVAWTPDLGPGVRYPAFRRGFVEEVALSAGTLLRRGDRIARQVPLRRVCVTPRSRSLYRLADMPLLAHLEGLYLAGSRLGTGELGLLLASPHLRNLRELDLSDTGLGASGLRLLLAWPGLSQLTRLGLAGNDLDEADLRALARCPLLNNLKLLHLERNFLGDASAEALASSPYLGNLVAIDLFDNRIRGRGATALVCSGRLSSLRALGLACNRVGDLGTSVSAGAPGLTRFKLLDFRENPLSLASANLLREACAGRTVRLDPPRTGRNRAKAVVRTDQEDRFS